MTATLVGIVVRVVAAYVAGWALVFAAAASVGDVPVEIVALASWGLWLSSLIGCLIVGGGITLVILLFARRRRRTWGTVVGVGVAVWAVTFLALSWATLPSAAWFTFPIALVTAAVAALIAWLLTALNLRPQPA